MGATGRETANFVGGVAKVTGTYTGGLVGWIDPKRLQIPKTDDSRRVRLVGDLPLHISCRMPCADHMADQAAA